MNGTLTKHTHDMKKEDIVRRLEKRGWKVYFTFSQANYGPRRICAEHKSAGLYVQAYSLNELWKKANR